MEGLDLFSRFEWEALLKIAFAVVLGGAIGLEREFSGRPAGLRTHILVCLGATIIVLASTSIPSLFGSTYKETLRIDPGRIAAGIVTGIGFLGAGSILRTGEFVRGLTTAACIWFAGALGIVIGGGFYMLAIVSTAVVFVVLRFDDIFEARISSPVYRHLHVWINVAQADAFEKAGRVFLKERRIRVQDLDCGYEQEGNVMHMKFYLRTRNSLQSKEVVQRLMKEPGVLSLSWEN